MSFDLYAGERHAYIDSHEEFLFLLAQQEEACYPELMTLWEAFYDGPRLSPAQAGTLVHELIALSDAHGGVENNALARIVIRLLPFFSHAWKTQQEIRCLSD